MHYNNTRVAIRLARCFTIKSVPIDTLRSAKFYSLFAYLLKFISRIRHRVNDYDCLMCSYTKSGTLAWLARFEDQFCPS